jgi:putative DNA primase/helicase
VFCGTSNHSDYLQDSTGNRRFWSVPCTKADKERIAADRDQLWAEALVRYRNGENWWLWEPELIEQAEMVASARVVSHPWEHIITRAAAGKPVGSIVTVDEVLTLWIRKDPAYQTNGDAQRVGRILSSLGWVKARDR